MIKFPKDETAQENSSPIADNASVTPDLDKGAPTLKKRGRPKGSKNNNPLKSKINIEAIVSFHEMISLLPYAGSFKVSTDEAKALAAAWENFTAQYPELKVPPKMAAWFGLLSAASIIYGPRFLIVYMELKTAAQKEKNKKDELKRAKVIDIKNVTAPN